MSKWIKCEQGLPEEDGITQVLVMLANGKVSAAVISYPFSNPNSYIWDYDENIEYEDFEVTHWMPLPSPPESEQ